MKHLLTEITHSFRNDIHFYGCYMPNPVDSDENNKLFTDYLKQKRFDLGTQAVIHLWVFDDKENVPENFGTVQWDSDTIIEKCNVHAVINKNGDVDIIYDLRSEMNN